MRIRSMRNSRKALLVAATNLFVSRGSSSRNSLLVCRALSSRRQLQRRRNNHHDNDNGNKNINNNHWNGKQAKEEELQRKRDTDQSPFAPAAATAGGGLSPEQSKHTNLRNQARYRRLEVIRGLLFDNENNDDDDEADDVQQKGSSSSSNKQQRLVNDKHNGSPLQKEFQGLTALGDPYNPLLFSSSHIAFKQSHNQAFVSLANRAAADASNGMQDDSQDVDKDSSLRNSSSSSTAVATTSTAIARHSRRPVFYLDGPDGATTRALLDAGFAREDLYVTNEWKETWTSLLGAPFWLAKENCVWGRAQDVLQAKASSSEWNENNDGLENDDDNDDDVFNQHRSVCWGNIPFVACYLDGCGGKPEPIIEMIAALFGDQGPATTTATTKNHVNVADKNENQNQFLLAPTMAIGFTLTAAEPDGRELLDRVQQVTRATMTIARDKGYDMRHVGDNPTEYGVSVDLLKKHQGISTSWMMCTRV